MLGPICVESLNKRKSQRGKKKGKRSAELSEKLPGLTYTLGDGERARLAVMGKK